MSFPEPPFELSKDTELLQYLKNATDNFSFLQDPTKEMLRNLCDEANDCDYLGDEPEAVEKLKELWPQVLTDALRQLKRKDSREYDEKKKEPDFDSFFNKESLGVPELEKVIEAFTDFEGLMYGGRPNNYRDHLVHAFRVWIIGHGILKQSLYGKMSIEGYVDDGKKANAKPECQIAPEEWESMWAIVALCHDIGYPFSETGNITGKMEETLATHGLQPQGSLRFDFSPRAASLNDTILRITSSRIVTSRDEKKRYYTHLQNKYYMKFLRAFEKLQHGVLSSVLMAGCLVYFLESDLCHDNTKALKPEDARQFLIRREILRAIAAHTCPDIYHVQFNTLSFLLYIVDELQAWGRPTFEQMKEGWKSNDNDLVTVRKFDQKDIEVEIAAAGEWKDRMKRAEHQLVGLNRRLRLGPDARNLYDSTLNFAVVPKDGQETDCEMKLTLHKGKITKEGY